LTELRIPVHPLYAADIQRDERKTQELVMCATDFRHFLKYWSFIDSRTGTQRKLGNELWSGQQQFCDAVESNEKLFALKARKLGYTTIATAYDAWCARFRGTNERIHLFSRRDHAAVELLNGVKYGLKRLPPWLTLPVGVNTSHEFSLIAGEDDERLVVAYPADEDTAVEATCTHGHVDEWARMGNPARVWQAVEPSMAGTCHIITTGMGPNNFPAMFWRRCMAGDTDVAPIFIDALQRPDRDMKWLEDKKKAMTEEQFRREYAMSWKDALFGGGVFKFKAGDLDVCSSQGTGPMSPVEEHKYVVACDVGRHHDAAVIIAIDVTDQSSPVNVVEYKRLRGVPYPELQRVIEQMHDEYPGVLAIEANAAGEAVAENLEIPEREVTLFKTTKPSKARIIDKLQFLVEKHQLAYSDKHYPQLDVELRGYQIPDDNIVQDSVMALAIACEYTDAGARKGRIGKIFSF